MTEQTDTFPEVGFCYATAGGYLGRLQSKRLEVEGGPPQTTMLIGTFQQGPFTKEIEVGTFPYLNITQVLCQDEQPTTSDAMDTADSDEEDEFGGKRRRRRRHRTPRGRKSRRKSLRQRK
jgi:hypothetical protein